MPTPTIAPPNPNPNLLLAHDFGVLGRLLGKGPAVVQQPTFDLDKHDLEQIERHAVQVVLPIRVGPEWEEVGGG